MLLQNQIRKWNFRKGKSMSGEILYKLGRPIVELYAGLMFKLNVLQHIPLPKGPKIIVFKYKAKERYRRKQGHRQQYTLLQVDEIAVK